MIVSRLYREESRFSNQVRSTLRAIFRHSTFRVNPFRPVRVEPRHSIAMHRRARRARPYKTTACEPAGGATRRRFHAKRQTLGRSVSSHSLVRRSAQREGGSLRYRRIEAGTQRELDYVGQTARDHSFTFRQYEGTGTFSAESNIEIWPLSGRRIHARVAGGRRLREPEPPSLRRSGRRAARRRGRAGRAPPAWFLFPESPP